MANQLMRGARTGPGAVTAAGCAHCSQQPAGQSKMYVTGGPLTGCHLQAAVCRQGDGTCLPEQVEALQACAAERSRSSTSLCGTVTVHCRAANNSCSIAHSRTHRMRVSPLISSMRKKTALSPCGTCNKTCLVCVMLTKHRASNSEHAQRSCAVCVHEDSGACGSSSHLDQRVLHKALGAGHRQLKHRRVLPGGSTHTALNVHLHSLFGDIST